ncbi:MAG TPA: RNA methyltransferase [Chloroflexota bacterium]|jgi:tRNA G18 (ribose-2'-O)-methylase SpoU|nr:RNA methyltransferase [Chloroflexota bacterium]
MKTRPPGQGTVTLRRGVIRLQAADAAFRHLERLKHRQLYRHQCREFFVEGVKAINRARAHGWAFRALIFAAGRPLSSWARELLAATPHADHIEVSPSLMSRLSDKDHPSEVVATIGMPPESAERIRPPGEALVVVFDRPSSPGNLGSVIRSCQALGADGLIVTGAGTDLYHPLTVRASMGALFAMPTVRLDSHREVGRWVAGLAAPGRRPGSGTQRAQLVGTSAGAALPAEAVDLTVPTVLVFGNETSGLSAAYQGLCDLLVRIPMEGDADSLNVASAAAILLYEAGRQRRRAATSSGHR